MAQTPIRELSTASDVYQAQRTCSDALSGLPWLRLTSAELQRLGGKLFTQASHLIDLVAHEAERRAPWLRDPKAVGGTLRARQQRVEALRSLWLFLELTTEQVRSHYLLAHAALLDDVTGMCQATLAADPALPPLQAARRMLEKKFVSWKKAGRATTGPAPRTGA